MDQDRWAGAHYRVERDTVGVLMRKRQMRKATEIAIEHGDPVPQPAKDVVRIYNRAGEIVFEQDWGTHRSEAMAQEAQIVEDLLRMDVLTFVAKYGIGDQEAAGAPAQAEAPAPLADPWSDVPTAVERPSLDDPAESESPGRQDWRSG